jgi:hypothetical protein
MRIYRLSSPKTVVYKYRLRTNVHCSGNLNNIWYVRRTFLLCCWTFALQKTVQVGREELITLTQGSLRDPGSIQALEGASAELYKALQAGRDRGELGGSTLNSVVTYPQTWLLQWSVWRSIEHTTFSSANGCMNTRASCLQLRCA